MPFNIPPELPKATPIIISESATHIVTAADLRAGAPASYTERSIWKAKRHDRHR